MTAFDPTPLRPDAPALPTDTYRDDKGLTARQHAAIALCVPDSGTPWLDDMINRRRRDEFASKATAACLIAIMPEECHRWSNDDFATEGYLIADAMLAASNKEPE